MVRCNKSCNLFLNIRTEINKDRENMEMQDNDQIITTVKLFEQSVKIILINIYFNNY